MKTSFVLYHDIRSALELLTDAQRGKLFLAILNYSERRETPELNDSALEMAFAFIRNTLDRDAAAWEEKRQKRIAAGSLGGKQTAANRANAAFAEQTKQSQANQAVPVPAPVPAPVPEVIGADKPPRSRFKKPSVDEVRAYCDARVNSIDPAYFVDYYDARGWKVGSSPMKDWKATIRCWENREDKSKLDDRANQNPFINALRQEGML